MVKVQSLDWKDPLGEGMATHSSILACRIAWTEEPSGLQSMGLQRVKHKRVTNTFTSSSSVVKIPCFHCQRNSSNSGRVTKIPHATQHGKKKKSLLFSEYSP